MEGQRNLFINVVVVKSIRGDKDYICIERTSIKLEDQRNLVINVIVVKSISEDKVYICIGKTSINANNALNGKAKSTPN